MRAASTPFAAFSAAALVDCFFFATVPVAAATVAVAVIAAAVNVTFLLMVQSVHLSFYLKTLCFTELHGGISIHAL